MWIKNPPSGKWHYAVHHEDSFAVCGTVISHEAIRVRDGRSVCNECKRRESMSKSQAYWLAHSSGIGVNQAREIEHEARLLVAKGDYIQESTIRMFAGKYSLGFTKARKYLAWVNDRVREEKLAIITNHLNPQKDIQIKYAQQFGLTLNRAEAEWQSQHKHSYKAQIAKLKEEEIKNAIERINQKSIQEQELHSKHLAQELQRKKELEETWRPVAEMRHRHELEHQRQEQEKWQIITAKRLSGKAEATVGNLVTLKNVETQEELTFYFASDEIALQNGHYVYVDSLTGLPDNVECIRANRPVGYALADSFVGDEISVVVEDTLTRYLILNVEPYKNTATEAAQSGLFEDSDQAEQSIFSGRGKPENGDSQGLDGSKYIGFMARDNGEYGSFPIHDDYGDESDAEGRDYGEYSE